jgi:hypothetical protein
VSGTNPTPVPRHGRGQEEDQNSRRGGSHGHSQLGWQGHPVDPVPALGAAPGPHPGVFADRVSAQEVLRKKRRNHFFWTLVVAHLCIHFPPGFIRIPTGQSRTESAQGTAHQTPISVKVELDACWLPGTVLRIGSQKRGDPISALIGVPINTPWVLSGQSVEDQRNDSNT